MVHLKPVRYIVTMLGDRTAEILKAFYNNRTSATTSSKANTHMLSPLSAKLPDVVPVGFLKKSWTSATNSRAKYDSYFPPPLLTSRNVFRQPMGMRPAISSEQGGAPRYWLSSNLLQRIDCCHKLSSFSPAMAKSWSS